MSGIVTEVDGNWLPGATVTAQSTSSNTSYLVQTNSKGFFHIPLELGTYVMTVQKLPTHTKISTTFVVFFSCNIQYNTLIFEII